MRTLLVGSWQRTRLLAATVVRRLKSELLRALYDYAADWVPPRAYSIVVAVSRCSGVLAEILAERVREGLVVGLEENYESALIVSKRAEKGGLGGKVDVLVGSERMLPLRSCCVDTLVSVGVLRYVEETTRFLTESLRVLRPEGRAVVVELIRNASRREYASLAKRLGTSPLLLRLGATLYGLLRERGTLDLPGRTLRNAYGSIRLWAEPAVLLILLSRVTRQFSLV